MSGTRTRAWKIYKLGKNSGPQSKWTLKRSKNKTAPGLFCFVSFFLSFGKKKRRRHDSVGERGAKNLGSTEFFFPAFGLAVSFGSRHVFPFFFLRRPPAGPTWATRHLFLSLSLTHKHFWNHENEASAPRAERLFRFLFFYFFIFFLLLAARPIRLPLRADRSAAVFPLRDLICVVAHLLVPFAKSIATRPVQSSSTSGRRKDKFLPGVLPSFYRVTKGLARLVGGWPASRNGGHCHCIVSRSPKMSSNGFTKKWIAKKNALAFVEMVGVDSALPFFLFCWSCWHIF